MFDFTPLEQEVMGLYMDCPTYAYFLVGIFHSVALVTVYEKQQLNAKISAFHRTFSILCEIF